MPVKQIKVVRVCYQTRPFIRILSEPALQIDRERERERERRQVNVNKAPPTQIHRDAKYGISTYDRDKLCKCELNITVEERNRKYREICLDTN